VFLRMKLTDEEQRRDSRSCQKKAAGVSGLWWVD